MVVLLEAINYGWVHEEVNAGMLQLINQCLDDDVVYVGEKEQVKTIRRLHKGKRVSFATCSKILEDEEKDSCKSVFYYIRLINSCINKYSPRQIFVLYANPICLLATLLVSLVHRKVSFRICIHGTVERNLHYKKAYKRLFKFAQCNEKVKIITFSPYCTDSYWEIRNKMNFIHHPFIPAVIRHDSDNIKDRKVIIGVIGACANPRAKKIIVAINRMKLDCDYEFWVASRFAKQFERMEHVRIIDLSFERKEMEAQIQKMDCMLLPYDKNEYQISASGVLWDAVSNHVPCFMLDSPYFCYYVKNISGKTLESEEELIQSLAEFIVNPDVESFGNSNVKELRDYNINIMKTLLD